MADLRTDYKDDLLNAEANELRKYQMIQNDDGTVSFVDVTVYLQVGDSFGAKNINELSIETNLSVKSENVKKIELVTQLPTTGVEGTVYFTYDA